MSSSFTDIDPQSFKDLQHAITLIGMSGIGKTVLSTALRQSGHWYHYSADYRIGTRYLSEDILDNIKYKIMNMEDQFIANLLRSDSIYISHNISVDNLEPVSTFLGMYGDTALGGLGKKTFLERQDLYRKAEVESMLDVEHFIDKGWRLFGCKDFVNDASGSLCEICEPQDLDDPLMNSLREQTLILYIQPGDGHEDVLKERARLHPKPLFYNPTFINPRIKDSPEDGHGIEPLDFARPLFPELLEFRKPRYESIASNFGFTITVEELCQCTGDGMKVPDSEQFLKNIHAVIIKQAKASERAAQNLEIYLNSCQTRLQNRQRVS